MEEDEDETKAKSDNEDEVCHILIIYHISLLFIHSMKLYSGTEIVFLCSCKYHSIWACICNYKILGNCFLRLKIFVSHFFQLIRLLVIVGLVFEVGGYV